MMELIPRNRDQRLIALPIRMMRAWLSPRVRRVIWRLLTIASLTLVGVGLFYAWQDLPRDAVRISPVYLLLAGCIYAVTYLMHTLGWDALARHFFGARSLRDNAEAVAASNLVKYLPTIAWYIASRTEYYQQRDVPRKLVVAASLCELAAMIGVGALFYLLGRVVPHSLVLSLGVLLAAALVVASAGRSQGLLHLWVRRRFNVSRVVSHDHRHRTWLAALGWYGGTWPIGVLFLAAIMQMFTPLASSDLWLLSNIWLLAGLASYAVSLSLGSLGIAREITLTYLLMQHWPLHIAVAAAIMVKILLTLGEIGCSMLVLLYMRLTRRAR
jgi:hypothetical protein